MYIDKKVTAWKRFYFPNDIEVPDFSNDNEINVFIDENIESCEDLQMDFDEMTVHQNGGFSTIEVFDDNNSIIYQNGN